MESKVFTPDQDGYVRVFTDGSCENNGKTSARAGIGVYFGDNHRCNLSEPVQGPKATNNTAEIQAATRAIEVARDQGVPKLHIFTDSNFLLKSVNDKSYMEKWKVNGWINSKNEDVKNKQDFQKLNRVLEDSDVNVKWSHVRGHMGNRGNEEADQLARDGAQRYVRR